MLQIYISFKCLSLSTKLLSSGQALSWQNAPGFGKVVAYYIRKYCMTSKGIADIIVCRWAKSEVHASYTIVTLFIKV